MQISEKFNDLFQSAKNNYFNFRRVILTLGILVLFIPLFTWAYFSTVPSEDAVILFEYSRNLVERGLITYGGSPKPIEGATDFLWMLLISILNIFGFDEFAAALMLSFFGIVVSILVFRRGKERILLGIAILVTPFLYASLSGFSTIFFVSIYLVALNLLASEGKSIYLVLLILCLVRPDGVIWGGGVVLLRILNACKTKTVRTEAKNLFYFLILPGLVYFLWRLQYFSEILPLPFLVKSGQLRDFGPFYYLSVKTVMYIFIPLFLLLMIFARRFTEVKEFGILFFPPILFYSALVLEQNVGYRFMGPLFFGTMFYLQKQYGFKAFITVVLISVPLLFRSTFWTTVNMIDSKVETVPHLSMDLSSLKGRMLVTEAGRLTFNSRWKSEDSWGLNSPKYAKEMIRVKDIKPNSYDLVVAHCELELLDMKTIGFLSTNRSWTNQCKVLVTAINKNGYKVYLVPYYQELSLRERIRFLSSGSQSDLNEFSKCRRYDIYAISSLYENSEQLIRIIEKYNALEFNSELVLSKDSVCI